MSSRVLAIWCPDWPAVAAAAAATLPQTHPVAVVHANRVIACSATARADGVRRGLRRREAQSRCPSVHIAQSDPDRDARLFEPVVSAVDAVAPGVEVLRPGLMLLPARGVVRYFGSEERAAEQLVDAVGAAGAECQIGIADELSTAVIAARHATFVPVGKGADFLAPLAIAEISAEPSLSAPDRGELIDLLTRLGLRTIGAFAALSPRDVASRFGNDAVLAHRSARGEPERPPSARALPPDLDVEQYCDPPIDRVDAAAFAGRALAEQLHAKLTAAAVACTRLLVQATTGNGEGLSRTWRCAQPLTPEGTADRVRWQLDGWLTGRNGTRPTAGITMLRLEPVEVISAGALQLGLWGGVGEEEERARRALIRVQGLLGGEAVQMPVLSGGRGPAERISTVPLGDEVLAAADPDAPWPGRLPAPAPAVVLDARTQVVLEGPGGVPVRVGARGTFTDAPAQLRWGTKVWPLRGWSGPWSADERWWDPVAAQCASRAQVMIDGKALLLIYCNDRWSVEGVYE
ncbi:DNA polymerase Y family protein [Smaragdicoccus niigatensis]|uniref:DNA polymerase Y family protein n=1 Tax=Smaragdicoccus niigatensis TaxID=359359 RepID=UPI000477D1D6|nr:DNA polymerase Y family protein [Smaragdicoccus niigatensis]